MPGKDDLLEAVLTECRIILRLYAQLPEGAAYYRPTPGQRSTLELLRYLSFGPVATAHALYEGDWQWWTAHEAEALAMTLEAFPAAMDRQMAEFRALFGRITDTEFASKPVVNKMWETKKPLGPKLMDTCFAFTVGYKMQLFLYAKAAGAANLNTVDCWFLAEPPAAL